MGFDIPGYDGEELYFQKVGGQGVAIIAERVFQYAEGWIGSENPGKGESPEAVLPTGKGTDIE